MPPSEDTGLLPSGSLAPLLLQQFRCQHRMLHREANIVKLHGSQNLALVKLGPLYLFNASHLVHMSHKSLINAESRQDFVKHKQSRHIQHPNHKE